MIEPVTIYKPGLRVQTFFQLPRHIPPGSPIARVRALDYQALDAELHRQRSSINEIIRKGKIWRFKFPNVITDIVDLTYHNQQVTLLLRPIHPHRADLSYREDTTLPEQRRASPLTVNGFLRLEDQTTILGIRGGSVEANTIGGIPGGHARYDPSHPEDLCLQALVGEAEKEGRLQPADFEALPYALFHNRDTQGLHMSYVLSTGLEFEEIKEQWKSADDHFEHKRLIQVTDDLLATGAHNARLKVEGKQYGIAPFWRDACSLYLHHLRVSNEA